MKASDSRLALAAVSLVAALLRLHPLIVTYTPPAYIGGSPEEYEDPESVPGIEGGTVQINGRGRTEDVTATLGADTLVAQPASVGWIITVRMPAVRAAVYVADGMEDRSITLEPVRDSLPVVTLLEPARDTVVRSAHGQIHLAARVSDDHGVAEAYFEYVATSGSGKVQSRTGRLGGWSGQQVDGLLSLDSLRLGPGDVLQLRAVARDFGPEARGLGVSETRTYRVDTASLVPSPRP